jgi:hypothetical protein
MTSSSCCSCHHTPALDPAGHRVPRTKPTCLLHTWRPHRRRPFALVLHLHQHQSSRNLHLQYLAKNQSTQRCRSLITQGSDHPPVLKPHMVLTRGLSHASRLPSHRVRHPHSMSASHVAPAMSAGPTQRLHPRAWPVRRSYPSTTWTPTPLPATTRTPTLSPASTRIPLTSSTSGRTPMSPSSRTTPQSNPCEDQLPAWL